MPSDEDTLCPLCGNLVSFRDYRGRATALCPVCGSLERVRLKNLYLKQVKGITCAKNLSVLHFGPHIETGNWLKSLQNIDYISSDPYNVANFKFPIEEIPFQDNFFDLILCIAVLPHVLDDHRALREMCRVLKPGGELLAWVGRLGSPATEERYLREEFPLMVAHDFSSPSNFSSPEVVRKDGRIFYNPRYPTRLYGLDLLEKLAVFGFEYRRVAATDIVASGPLRHPR